jgi:hypothetical protein
VSARIVEFLRSIRGVNAVKVEKDRIIVYCDEGTILPTAVDGIPVEKRIGGRAKIMSYVVETEKIVEGKSRTEEWRPAPGGVSIGHYNISAGTLGCIVYGVDGEPLILSNNHILADCNRGVLGDPILQPGPYDGGKNKIGELLNFVPIKAKNNYCDAAVARPISKDLITNEILEIGVIDGVSSVKEGDVIEKSGRSCGYKKAKVIGTGFSVTVDGYPFGAAVFEDQILTEPILIPGDSGSLGVITVDGKKKAFGLGFAGGDEYSVFNPIKYVIDSLKVSFTFSEEDQENVESKKYLLYGVILALPAGMLFGTVATERRRKK